MRPDQARRARYPNRPDPHIPQQPTDRHRRPPTRPFRPNNPACRPRAPPKSSPCRPWPRKRLECLGQTLAIVVVGIGKRHRVDPCSSRISDITTPSRAPDGAVRKNRPLSSASERPGDVADGEIITIPLGSATLARIAPVTPEQSPPRMALMPSDVIRRSAAVVAAFESIQVESPRSGITVDPPRNRPESLISFIASSAPLAIAGIIDSTGPVKPRTTPMAPESPAPGCMPAARRPQGNGQPDPITRSWDVSHEMPPRFSAGKSHTAPQTPFRVHARIYQPRQTAVQRRPRHRNY